MTDAQSIITAASQLPEYERVQVIEALLDGLEPEAAEDAEQVARAWRTELQKRSQEVRTGAVTAVAWSEVRAEGEKLLDESAS